MKAAEATNVLVRIWYRLLNINDHEILIFDFKDLKKEIIKKHRITNFEKGMQYSATSLHDG